MDKLNQKNDYIRGLKDGVPVGLGYLPVSMACGIASSSAGISFIATQLMSIMIYSGSGQATATNLFAGGELSIFMYALTLFVMNCRYLLFSISLSQRLDPSAKMYEKMLVGALNTDEVFGVVLREKGYITTKYFLGVATLPFLCFLLGNLVGSFATNVLPTSVSSVMDMMLYAMFIVLIVPSAKRSKPVLCVVLMALALSVLMEGIPGVKEALHLTPGLIIIICAVVTSLIGAILFPISQEETEAV